MDEIGQQIETLMFCDVVAGAGGPRFLIRYLGARLAMAYGGDRTGEYLDTVLPPIWRDGAIETYRLAASGGRPVYNIVETADSSGGELNLERLILPFTSGQATGVDRILASIESVSLNGKFEQTGLASSPFVGSNCILNAVIESD